MTICRNYNSSRGCNNPSCKRQHIRIEGRKTGSHEDRKRAYRAVEEDAERKSKEKVLEPMIEAVRKELSERVEEVRFSKRLTDSPACLVAADNALPQHLVRMMRDQGQDVPEPKQVLELNATHPLIERMGKQIEGNFAKFSSSCELLFGLAQLSEGTAPSDPAKFTQLVSEMMLGNE